MRSNLSVTVAMSIAVFSKTLHNLIVSMSVEDRSQEKIDYSTISTYSTKRAAQSESGEKIRHRRWSSQTKHLVIVDYFFVVTQSQQSEKVSISLSACFDALLVKSSPSLAPSVGVGTTCVCEIQPTHTIKWTQIYIIDGFSLTCSPRLVLVHLFPCRQHLTARVFRHCEVPRIGRRVA